MTFATPRLHDDLARESDAGTTSADIYNLASLMTPVQPDDEDLLAARKRLRNDRRRMVGLPEYRPAVPEPALAFSDAAAGRGLPQPYVEGGDYDTPEPELTPAQVDSIFMPPAPAPASKNPYPRCYNCDTCHRPLPEYDCRINTPPRPWLPWQLQRWEMPQATTPLGRRILEVTAGDPGHDDGLTDDKAWRESGYYRANAAEGYVPA